MRHGYDVRILANQFNAKTAEIRLTHFFDGVRADVVYQTQRMWPLRPDKDVSAASVLSPQPSDALADLLDTLVAVQNHSGVPAHHSDFKARAPHRGELLMCDRFRD